MLVAHVWLQQQKQIYRLRNVCAGYVLYRALVLLPRAHAQGGKVIGRVVIVVVVVSTKIAISRGMGT